MHNECDVATEPDLLIPEDDETDNQYRARLRTFLDSVESTDTEGFRRSTWEYICSLAGVAPDDTPE